MIGLLFVLSLFGAQLVRIQGLDAGGTAEAGQKLRVVNETLPALRGTITDATGTILASSIEKRDVIADPTAIPKYQKTVAKKLTVVGVDGAVADLAPLLGMDPATLKVKLTVKGQYSRVIDNISPLTWNEVAKLGIPGITSVRTSERTYPQATTAASLIGITNAGQDGVSGLEAYLNPTLRGTPGELKYEIGQDGIRLPMGFTKESAATNGHDVQLTIRNDLQWYAQNALAQKIKEVKAASGTVVVQSAKTGELLALASYPTFDPNDLSKGVGSWNNLAFSEVFEPGSTAKVVTAAAALEEGKVSPSTPMVVPYSLHRSDRTFSDSHAHPTEYLTFAGALAQSSNTGIILVSETLKAAVLEEYFRKFGFGAKSAVSFPGESSGLLAKSSDWSGSQRYTVAFGQGLSITAIQAAGVYQTIANGGVHIAPSLIKATQNASGTMVAAPAPEQNRVISKNTATQLSQMLEGVVGSEGTAPAAVIDGYRVAGKTGTASYYDAKVGNYRGYTASFIGYAPAADPELVVSVIVQKPTSPYYGGLVAAPVFHDVMTYALSSLDIPPTPGDTTPPELTLKLTSPPDANDPAVLRDGRR